MSSTRIVYNEALSDDHYVMGLSWNSEDGSYGDVRAGQFVMLKVSEDYDPLLRRPFGIYNHLSTDEATGEVETVEIIYRVVGKGTAIMSRLMPGVEIDILGPLGNGFPELEEGQELVMVAGGIGIAPFKMLAAKYPDSVLLFGAKDSAEAILVNDIKELGTRVKVATEDGSRGSKGLVTDLMATELNKRSVVYACGPLGMLKAVSEVSYKNRVDCFVSLERTMACGVGACLGCAVRTKEADREKEKDKNAKFENLKMVCKDGPVFNSLNIDWDLL
jgi:dihydroorotate dehydrogenase electron transfer subunit